LPRPLLLLVAISRSRGPGHRIPLSIGIGIAPPKASTPEQMIAEADVAMDEAKRAGGSAYRIFDGG
jgi:GGDEF domain-containing protein